jgi:hypothetical protein
MHYLPTTCRCCRRASFFWRGDTTPTGAVRSCNVQELLPVLVLAGRRTFTLVLRRPGQGILRERGTCRLQEASSRQGKLGRAAETGKLGRAAATGEA